MDIVQNVYNFFIQFGSVMVGESEEGLDLNTV